MSIKYVDQAAMNRLISKAKTMMDNKIIAALANQSGGGASLPAADTAGLLLRSTGISGGYEWAAVKYGAALSVSGTSIQLKDQDGNDLGSPITTQDTGAVYVATASENYVYNDYTSFTTTADYIGFKVGVSNNGDISYVAVTDDNKDTLSITPGTTVAYLTANGGTSLSYNSSNRTMTLNRNKVFIELNDIDNALSTTSRNPIQNRVIAQLIPAQANSSNPLTDRDFVNSSITTATATFRGDYDVVVDLELTRAATSSQIATALASKISTADNNDYCFVQIPSTSYEEYDGYDQFSSEDDYIGYYVVDNNAYTVVTDSNKSTLSIIAGTTKAYKARLERVDRYKHNGTAWALEFPINNSGFTSNQWAAINSGATSASITASTNMATILNAEYIELAGFLAQEGIYTSDNKKISYLAEYLYSNKLNSANPTGSGSLSINRKASTTIGSNSVALGNNNTADGQYSFAEGGTTRSGGFCSHSEGYQTEANNSAAHAEGSNTSATGSYSHSQGYYTQAQRKSQHVFGEYNTADTGGTGTSDRGTYVEIVGNGTADNARSNARTLDWSGNETLAGNLKAAGLTDGTTTTTMSNILAAVNAFTVTNILQQEVV